MIRSKFKAAWWISLLGLMSMAPGVAAPFQSDPFSGTTIDGSKWQLPPGGSGSGVFTQNNGLSYHNNGNGTGGDEVRLVSRGTGSTSTDWSVWMDVEIPILSKINADGKNVGIALKIWNNADPAQGLDLSTILVQDDGFGKLRPIGTDINTAAGEHSRGVFLDVAGHSTISMGISWQASAKTFTVWVAPHGGGTDWIRLANWNVAPGSPTQWDLDPAQGFGLAIEASSENVDLLPGDKVRVSGFACDNALISGRVPPEITTGIYMNRTTEFHPLPGAELGMPYSQPLDAADGVAPYTWSVVALGLPPGLALATNGTISGTPTTPGTYPFRVRVMGADGAYSESHFSIAVTPDPFIGSYTPLGEYDTNIRSFSGELEQYTPLWFSVSQDDPTHYTTNFGAGSLVVPNLQPYGNRIQNTIRPMFLSYFYLLDFIMLSDGVNRALVQVAYETYDPDDVSVIVASWSSHTGNVTVDDFVGTWNLELYDDPNLRNTSDGFDHEFLSTEIQQVDANHIQVMLPGGGALPLRVTGNEAFLETQPFIVVGSRFHSFRIHTDGQKLSLHAVISEPDDLTDVGVSIGLGVRVSSGWAPASIAGKALTYNYPDGWWRLRFNADGTGVNETSDGEVESLTYSYTTTGNIGTIGINADGWAEATVMTYTSEFEGTFGYQFYENGILDMDHTGSFVVSGNNIMMNFLIFPAVTTGSASEVTATSATLHGKVNPHGPVTTARFEYGLTTAYGSTAGVTLSPDDGFSDQEVSAAIVGLQGGKTYHYRLTATNAEHPALGADMTFDTPPPISPGELVAPTIRLVGGSLEFTIRPSVSGRRYQLQQSDTLEPGSWIDVGTVYPGDGNDLVITIPHEPTAPRRFYRLALDPVPAP